MYTGQPNPQQPYAGAYPPAQYPGAYPQAPVPQVMYHAPPPISYGLTNRPNDWLFFNIFSCVCCCCPIGSFAIWKSMESRKAADRGDRDNAVRNAEMAKQLGLCALVVGILINIVMLVLVIVLTSNTVEELANAAKNGTDVNIEMTTELYSFDGAM